MHVYGGINAVTVPTKFGHAPRWPGDSQMPFISRISSIELLQNKSLFQVLREDFLTMVFPSLVFLGEM